MARDAASLARTLAERHAARATFTSIFDEDETPDLAFAYEVQAAFVAGLGGDTAGYKIGLTTPRMQEMCGVSEPICGVVLKGRILRSPATVRAADYVRLGLESEMAVRIAPGADQRGLAVRDLPAHHLIDQVCAGFELVEDSGADYRRLTAASIVADNGWNAGLVFGEPSPAAAYGPLRGRRGVLKLNGAAVNEGKSEDVLGDPLNAVRWLAGRLQDRGGLKPGMWVSTGAIVPTRFVAPGETYVFEIDGLAPVTLKVA